MFAAFARKDTAAGLRAYRERNALTGAHSFPRLALAWIRFGRIAWVASTLLAAVGVWLDNAWLVLAGTIGLLAFAPLAAHMTRNRRSVIFVLAAIALLWTGYLL